MWFTAASFVGQVEATGTVRRFAIPAGAKPSRPALFASPDGSLWFDVDAGWARVTGDGAVTLLPGRGFLETVTSDGHAVVGAAGRRLARVAPVGTRTVLPGRAPGEPAQRTPGPDGNLWFTLGAGNGHAGVVYRQSMADGSVTAFRLPGERMAIPSRPIAGPGNRLWTTQSGTTARLYSVGTDGGARQHRLGSARAGQWQAADVLGASRRVVWATWTVAHPSPGAREPMSVITRLYRVTPG